MSEIIEYLESATDTQSMLRERIATYLQGDHNDPTSLHLATTTLLELCVQLWFMCNIPISPGPQTAWQQYSHPQIWVNDAETLRQHMETCFPRSLTVYTNVKLDKQFRLYDICRVANFEVKWTDDLLEHLRVRDPRCDGDPWTVSVFHHRQFLEYHAARPSSIYPDGLITETMRTLDLLLPHEHEATQTWYTALTARRELDPSACKMRPPMELEERGLERFSFWRDRLAILKETFDELEPRTVFHFWLDKRRPIQWATFWVAVLVLGLTVFFGLVQSIEGALQVYKAYHPTVELQ